jgi:hypothetical protein
LIKTFDGTSTSVYKTIVIGANCSTLEYLAPVAPTESFIVDEIGTYSPDRNLINDDEGVSWTPTCGEATITFSNLQSFMHSSGNSLTIAGL